jgi:hypothetical protein
MEKGRLVDSITENITTPVKDHYDVVVAGGGVAGVAAALAARRAGARVLLLEKTVALGGQATVGLIRVYLPLCDGGRRKAIGGISEELLWLSIKYGYGDLSPEWRRRYEKGGGVPEDHTPRYRTVFAPTAFIMALDEIVEAEGIDLRLDTLACRPLVEDGVCTAVIVESKYGRSAYGCSAVVDATGDADLFVRAGAACHTQGNRLTSWAEAVSLESCSRAVDAGIAFKAIEGHRLGIHLDFDRGFVIPPGGAPEYFLDQEDTVTRLLLDSRRIYREKLLADRAPEELTMTAFPGVPLFRTTRAIKGLYDLTSADSKTSFADSVGCAGDWRLRGPVYEIPYRSLVSADLANVIAAGRCIASLGDAWEVTRVIPVAAATGQAAGEAAALAADGKVSLQEVPVDRLQQRLAAAGVILHREDMPS